jgi:hypothetical protein
MTLATLFQRLTAEAIARGEAFARLKQGATVKIRARDRARQVILGRRPQPVGEVEERTFREHGKIPADAARAAYGPTPDGWHYVAYTWEEPPGLFDEQSEGADEDRP